MRTTDVIDRISSLEAMGRLTGVMDERGKVRGNKLLVQPYGRGAWEGR